MLLRDNRHWLEIAGRITENDFSSREHRLIYQGIAQLLGRNDPSDVITVSEWLEAQGALDEVGGLKALGALARDAPINMDIAACADFLRVTTRRRRMRESVIEGAKDDGKGRDRSD